jgi:hypothetical protein
MNNTTTIKLHPHVTRAILERGDCLDKAMIGIMLSSYSTGLRRHDHVLGNRFFSGICALQKHNSPRPSVDQAEYGTIVRRARELGLYE